MSTSTLPFEMPPTADELPHDEAEGQPPLVELPPTADELPYDDGAPVESQKHRLQQSLCTDPLARHLAHRSDVFIGSNQALYYSLLQLKRTDFRAPDVMVALGVEHRLRKSWVMWEEEGRVPDVIIELLSGSTAAVDKGEKLRIYESLVRVPECFLFDPEGGELLGYRLADTDGRLAYVPIRPTAAGRLPCRQLGLELGRWEGEYQGYGDFWLRWFTPEGAMLLTGEEAAAEAEARAGEAEARAGEAEARAGEAEARAARERQARQEAEAELAALRAQLAQKP